MWLPCEHTDLTESSMDSGTKLDQIEAPSVHVRPIRANLGTEPKRILSGVHGALWTNTIYSSMLAVKCQLYPLDFNGFLILQLF